jgi:hypothetical protein
MSMNDLSKPALLLPRPDCDPNVPGSHILIHSIIHLEKCILHKPSGSRALELTSLICPMGISTLVSFQPYRFPINVILSASGKDMIKRVHRDVDTHVIRNVVMNLVDRRRISLVKASVTDRTKSDICFGFRSGRLALSSKRFPRILKTWIS